MTKDEARKELLETLEEYCHDKGYNLQVFAGLSDLVYTLYPKEKTMTKAEYIRSLSDDDLANVKSVDAMINTLQTIKKLMIKDKLPKQDKKAVQDLMAFKERYRRNK